MSRPGNLSSSRPLFLFLVLTAIPQSPGLSSTGSSPSRRPRSNCVLTHEPRCLGNRTCLRDEGEA